MEDSGGDRPAPNVDEGRPYVLGHSDRELDRLISQARLIDPTTERFLRAAGIESGMRVLDIGTGAGDVAFLAARLVGDTGAVVGVDVGAAAIETAKARADAQSVRQVSFLVGDPAEMAFERPFDAVIGRYVLQFQADPARMLRKLAGLVRSGGVVVFHEIDWGGISSFPPVPTHDRACAWAAETLRRHGTETPMGAKLHSTFVAAGLAAPRLRLEALIAGGADSHDRLQLIADLIRTLLPEMERLGVATAADVGIETLVERMMAEVIRNSSVVVGHYQVGAWART